MYRTLITKQTQIFKSTTTTNKIPHILKPFSTSSPSTANMSSSSVNPNQNKEGQGVSHASDSSLPESIQRQAPKKLEDELPDSVHDTNSNKDTGKVSHAKGDSVVPQALQEALPESVEKAVPDFIHDTTGKTKK